MEFYQKLNKLMNIQNITNSRLAKALSVDASLVSRWRTGIRVPSPKSSYIKEIASFFTSQAKMESQKNMLLELLAVCPEHRPETSEELSQLVCDWLQEVPYQETKSRLEVSRSSDSPQNLKPTLSDVSNIFAGKPVKAEVYYGRKEKQRAVIRFLSEVSMSQRPCTLYLYSDESIQWLIENREFSSKWISLLLQVITQGYKIKIIHTITRDLSEMLAAIDQWLPIYMTGAVKSYYYSKYQEPICRRTMFIAPSIAAMTSSSLLMQEDFSQLFYFNDPAVIQNLNHEFQAFLKQCYPLMQVFKNENLQKFAELWGQFEEQYGDSIFYSSTLSSVTMPEAMFTRLLHQSGGTNEQKQMVYAIHKKIRSFFLSGLAHNNFTELVHLSLPETFPETTAVLNPRDLLGSTSICYSRSDYCEHLKNIVLLLKTQERFFFIFHEKDSMENFQFAFKEESGVVVAKNDCSIIFLFRQQSMIRAFQNYLDDILYRIPYKKRGKEAVIHKLEELIAQLEEP